MTSIVVADVGGTNARFGVIDADGSRYSCRNTLSYACSEFSKFEDMLAAYLHTLPERPGFACLALAAPIKRNFGRLTNVGFTVNGARIESLFGFKRVMLINDLAALAASVLHLADDQRLLVQKGESTVAPVSVLAAGTGFGAALLTPCNDFWMLTATEAGHKTFGPVDDLDFEIVANLRRSTSHVSVETMLSGAGLERLYRALIEVRGEHFEPLSADEISSRARHVADSRCVEALTVFFSILGSVAGDMALAHGAFGGVYLGGGVVTKNAPFIQGSRFSARFSAKGPMTEVVKNIPVHIINSSYASLIGAGQWFTQQSRREALN